MKALALALWIVGFALLMLPIHGVEAQPAGTYQRTCRNVRLEGDTLRASCRDEHSRYRETALADSGMCVANSIMNDNGVLRCSRKPVPDGSYKQSCNRIRVDGGVLYAICNTYSGGVFGGRTRSTSLSDYPSCRSQIENKDGYLDCKRQDNLPDGTYLRTCRNATITGNILTATCRVQLGGFSTTSIDTARCTQPISNRNGKLACTPAPSPPPPPPAPGYSAVEVFNCQGNRQPLVIWKSSQLSPDWSQIGILQSHYDGNLCQAAGPPSLHIALDPGYNVIRAQDASPCRIDDPADFNCFRGDHAVNGRNDGAVEPFSFGP